MYNMLLKKEVLLQSEEQQEQIRDRNSMEAIVAQHSEQREADMPAES